MYFFSFKKSVSFLKNIENPLKMLSLSLPGSIAPKISCHAVRQ
jgi:hypothetical protein